MILISIATIIGILFLISFVIVNIKPYFQRKMIKDTFSKYVSKETIQKLMNNEIDDSTLKEKEIEFIYIKINTTSLTEIAKLTEDIINYALEHNATVFDIISSYITIYFKFNDSFEFNPDRLQIVNLLIEQFQNNISIIHGKRIALVGVYGGKYRMTNGIIIQDYFAIMNELIDLPNGKSKEI